MEVTQGRLRLRELQGKTIVFQEGTREMRGGAGHTHARSPSRCLLFGACTQATSE